MKKVVFFIFLLAVFGGASCGINLFSTKEEVKMGAEFAKEVEKQSKLYKGKEWNDYIAALGQKIASISDRQNILYHFSIIDDSATVNAFALPGGYVYIYTGLLSRAENKAEVVGVLAHEVGHIVAKHGVERLSAMYGYQFIIALALGKNPNQTKAVIADVLGGVGMLQYGQKNEFEADQLGLKYLYALGYDPHTLVSFFEKLESINSRSPNKIEKFLSTHPQTSDRIKRIDQQIAVLPSKQNQQLNTEYYILMRQKLYQK